MSLQNCILLAEHHINNHLLIPQYVPQPSSLDTLHNLHQALTTQEKIHFKVYISKRLPSLPFGALAGGTGGAALAISWIIKNALIKSLQACCLASLGVFSSAIIGAMIGDKVFIDRNEAVDARINMACYEILLKLNLDPATHTMMRDYINHHYHRANLAENNFEPLLARQIPQAL